MDDALTIGETMAARFSDILPEGFYSPLKKSVITLETTKKCLKVGSGNAYDMEKLYARLLVMSERRNIQLQDLFKYELAPVPPSLFDEYGDMRKGPKNILLKKLAFTESNHLVPVDLEIVDGNEALYHTNWPKIGTVQHFSQSFCRTLSKPHITYVVFDKYMSGSIKFHERKRRAGGFNPQHHRLTLDSPLPPRDIIMKSDYNKKQLISVLCDTNNEYPLLHLIGEDQCRYNHEEADINIISYLLLLNENFSHVQVKADDTDIFVLLVYYVWKHNLTTQVSMKKYDGTVINISETASRLGSKCITLLPLHALTGCDTVSYPFGKGKISAANFLLKSDINLDAMCHSDTPDDTIIELGSMVLLYLYGCPSRETDLNSYRYQLFNKTRVTWLAFTQPQSRILGQHWVLKSVNSVLSPAFRREVFRFVSRDGDLFTNIKGL